MSTFDLITIFPSFRLATGKWSAGLIVPDENIVSDFKIGNAKVLTFKEFEKKYGALHPSHEHYVKLLKMSIIDSTGSPIEDCTVGYPLHIKSIANLS